MIAEIKRGEGRNVQETSKCNKAGDQISGHTELQMFDGKPSPENLGLMNSLEVISV